MPCLIPKTTKQEVKIMNRLSLNKIISLVLTLVIASLVGNAVHTYLRLPFIAFCGVINLILGAKAPSNPTKSFWKGLLEYYSFVITRKKLYSTQSKEYIAMKESEAIYLAEKESKKVTQK